MLGLCCHWLAEDGKNLLPSRRMQLGRFNQGKYTRAHIGEVYASNLQRVREFLPIFLEHNISVFRISSAMFSLFDKVDRDLWDNDQVCELLAEIGQFVLDNNMRITTHPGQFTVLSNAKTAPAAIREMNFHGWLFDRMGLPRTAYYAINVHGGGKPERTEELIRNIKLLDDSARSRMTLENCEFGWSVADLIPVSNETNVPICFDSHHHKFNAGELDGHTAMTLAMSTWPEGVKPLTHLSNEPPGLPDDAPSTKRRCHSDYIYEIPSWQREANNDGAIDIDVEAKKKNLAIFRMSKELGVTI